ncbi:MAG: response regulator, partial [Colwellia sp.]|nr:response regulator [Colwellia sp.]
QMRVMDGFEATKIIRNSSTSNKSLPIVAITANVSEEDKEHSFQVGMSLFLSKPINKRTIENALSQFLNINIH